MGGWFLWGVWSLFDTIADKKEFDDEKDNHASMGGKEHSEVEY